MLQRHLLMRHVIPGAMHVVLAGRADGLVGSVYTRAPIDWLLTISDSFNINRHEIRPSAHAERIVRAWRSRFAIEPQPGSLLPWFRAPFVDAVRALNDYNTRTGSAFQAIELDAPVLVKASGSLGRVIGFSRCGRVAVRLEVSPLVCNMSLVRREGLELALFKPRAEQT
jgi:hypothetical protein